MRSIPDEVIAEVRARVDIAALIGKKVALKRTGSSLVGLCPFHNERSPSFHVTPSRGFYHCFGCQASGDVFKFITETEHTPFPQVVRDLAKEVGVNVPEDEETPEEKKAREKKQWLWRVNDYVTHFFAHYFWDEPEGATARRYIEGRKVTEETARSFSIGFAPRGTDLLREYLEAKKVPLDAVVEAGVFGKRDASANNPGELYSRFAGRVIFPIRDERGQICGFGGRILEKESKMAKYLNSPESAVFKKGTLFYGFDKAKHAIARQGGAILCEGYLDVIAMHQAGFEQAIAPLGTAVTAEHLPGLRRATQRCYTMFDGDSAGLKATRKSTELLLSHGFSVNVLSLPDGDDPDTYVQREGSAVLKERITAAPAALQFFIDQAGRLMTPSVEGRLAAARDLMPLIAKVSSQLERDLYVKEAAKKLQIDDDALRRFFGSGPKAAPAATRPNPPRSFEALQKSRGDETRLARGNDFRSNEPPPPGDYEDQAPAELPEAPRVYPPDPVEWSATIELLKYRTLWVALPDVERLIVHEGLRRIVAQCIENDGELTFEQMEAWLGSAALARNLAVVLSDDLSPKLQDQNGARLLADVKLGLEHYRKRCELLRIDQQIQAAANEVPDELLRRKRELIQWLKKEFPRFSGLHGTPREPGT